MKLSLTPTDLDALETSVQILLPDVLAAQASAVVAEGLGFDTAGSLRAALNGTTRSPLVCRINDAAAAATLMRLTGAAPEYGTLVTHAAVTAIPGCLEPETHDEGILKALARAVEGVRESDTERDEDGLYYDAFGDVVDAISLDIEHEGKNAFDCQLSLGADHERTIWLTNDVTGAQAILRGDYEALCAIVRDFDEDWITNYDPEDVPGSEHGAPDYDGGCFYNNIGVEVWRDGVTVTTWQTNGGVERTIIEIDVTTFAEIETIMERHSFGDANRVVEVLRAIGPLQSSSR
ncbi:hypothetical protein [Azospirillum agricola]|uniref:hypothetical protein n=1 Tax=Azospirillum agricola TaxID=1720247 RepID=UPI000A0EF76E|nr:hypothetical protein [Azospirillum agricola]SMH61432.1 hypothetical protein SAMN02982994_5828 [Azospirillum lipoferum]